MQKGIVKKYKIFLQPIISKMYAYDYGYSFLAIAIITRNTINY